VVGVEPAEVVVLVEERVVDDELVVDDVGALVVDPVPGRH
jgi:hypothetical protein